MTKEQILKKMEKLYRRMENYFKKSERMGLEKGEETKYYALFGEYIKLKLELSDLMFDEYILNEIAYDKTAKLKSELFKRLGWNSNLMIHDEQMEYVIDKYNKADNKEEIISLIEDYHIELMTNLNRYLINNKNRELLVELSKLIDEKDEDGYEEILKKHMDYKFEILYMLLAEENL